MEGLILEPEKHQYFWEGKRVPGITEIIKTLGLTKDTTYIDPYFATRGIAAHKAIELYLGDNLDEQTLDESYRGYFEGFKAWWTKTKKSVRCATEISLYSQRLNFAGTLDLVLDDMIVDYKTSKDVDPASELQGAAQQMLWGENCNELLPFRVLQLFKDGTFRLIDYDPMNPNLWENTMGLYAWFKKAHPRSIK